MKNQYRFTMLPKALRRPSAQLDNFSLVPVSLLPDLSAYQALSDRQPKGTAVMVLPSQTSPLRKVYVAVARVLQTNGMDVRLFYSTRP